MEDNVGTIVIGTKVNTKEATRDVQKLYKNIENLEKQASAMLQEIESMQFKKFDLQKQFAKSAIEAKKTKEQIEEINKQIDFHNQRVERINVDMMGEGLDEGTLRAMRFSKNTALEKITGLTYEREQLQESLEKENHLQEKISSELQKHNAQIEKKEATLERINMKLDDQNYKLNEATGKNGLDLSGISSGFSKIIKKVGKLALALVGVRTIINLITRSFNTLAEYNEELGTKMEQMRLVLAVALEPIINYIVSILSVVLNIIDKIYTALFGISLYGRASELWSQKMAKNMERSAGSAKEMRKQLAGFDEMNVLNDNVAGAGGGGFDAEDFILPDTPIPKGLQWIMDNGEPLGAIMGGVAGGALLMVDGLTRLHFALQEYENDPTLENFGEVVHRAGEAWAGFGMLTIDPVSTIAGSIMAISGILTNHKEEVDKWVDDTVKNVNDKADWLAQNVSPTLGGIFKNLGEDIDYTRDDFWSLMEEAQFDFDSIGKVIQKFKEGDIKGAWNEIVNWITGKWEKEKERFNRAIENIKTKITNFINGVKTDFEIVKNWIKEHIIGPVVDFASQKIEDAKKLISDVVQWIKDRFNSIVGFFQGIGIAIGDFFSGAVKGAVNGALSFVENRINDFIRMINNVVGIINKIPGVNIGRIGYVSLPRMAVGGIINQPGRGVPVGGAIAGESGREGILPLTDKQTMAELGKEIGKWISIQATVPVNIGNRQVARVIQELNNDREFAMNS